MTDGIAIIDFLLLSGAFEREWNVGGQHYKCGSVNNVAQWGHR